MAAVRIASIEAVSATSSVRIGGITAYTAVPSVRVAGVRAVSTEDLATIRIAEIAATTAGANIYFLRTLSGWDRPLKPIAL